MNGQAVKGITDPALLKEAFEQFRRTMQAEYIVQMSGCSWEEAIKVVRGEK